MAADMAWGGQIAPGAQSVPALAGLPERHARPPRQQQHRHSAQGQGGATPHLPPRTGPPRNGWQVSRDETRCRMTGVPE